MTLRILFITRVFPYPSHAGDLLYTAGIIESLGELKGSQVTVFCGSGLPENPPPSNVCWLGLTTLPGRKADFKSLLSRYPRAAERALSSKAIQKIDEIIGQGSFDIVFFNEAITAKAMSIINKYGIPSLYISHNVDADIRPQIAAASKKKVLRWIQKLDAAKYRQMELSLIQQVDGITAISPEDQSRYKELGCSAPSEVLKPGYKFSTVEKPLAHERRSEIAVLVGSFEWNAKVANLEKILKAYDNYLVNSDEIPFRLRIAGRASPKLVKRLSLRYPSVEFVCPFISLIDVVKDARIALVLEEMGGGFKLKVLDYVFSDLAIVGFRHAMQGTELTAETEYQEVPSMGKAIEIVHELIGDTARLKNMTNAARQKMEAEYNWSARALLLCHLANQVVRNPA